jgi:hypothetical protein
VPVIHLGITPQDTVRPCPFCGSDNIELHNTHRACYTVECVRCGAELMGKNYGGDIASDKLSRRHHTDAKRSALAKWNARATVIA